MTLAERAIVATAVRSRMAEERAEIYRRMLAEGVCRKRAMYCVGISERTASRYLQRVA